MVQCIITNHGNNGDYNQHYFWSFCLLRGKLFESAYQISSFKTINNSIHGILFKVKRYYKSRITYYNNAVASFNFLELHTQFSGDIHPQPGPYSQLSIPVRITQRSHRQKNSHLSCNHSTCTRIISKTMPTRHSSLMTINTT